MAVQTVERGLKKKNKKEEQDYIFDLGPSTGMSLSLSLSVTAASSLAVDCLGGIVGAAVAAAGDSALIAATDSKSVGLSSGRKTERVRR